ncbi:hypothetical protein EE612_003984 [Oryza sativa]|nr:hypothetical protein EE612_003984 [Oryza sativa]
MANPWRIAAVGWGVTVVGWLIAPIMNLLVNKFVSYIGFNASRKLRELEIHTLPKLEDMLRELEEQRMQKEAEDDRSAVKKLEQPCEELRSALYEAEDILDLIDYHQIKNKVNGMTQSALASSFAPANLPRCSQFLAHHRILRIPTVAANLPRCYQFLAHHWILRLRIPTVAAANLHLPRRYQFLGLHRILRIRSL